MSSIPVAGLAKALIVVTVSLHPGAAHHDPGSYTVRPGDTLSTIAARAYGTRPTGPPCGGPTAARYPTRP